MKNKKALSTIITVMILIGLSITSVSIIYVSLKTNLQDVLKSPTQCIGLQSNPPLSIKQACYNEEELEIFVEKENSFQKVNSIDFIINSKEKSLVYTCEEHCRNCRLPEKTGKQYFIDINGMTTPETLVFKIEDCVIETIKINEC
jgi:hypothetical protein